LIRYLGRYWLSTYWAAPLYDIHHTLHCMHTHHTQASSLHGLARRASDRPLALFVWGLTHPRRRRRRWPPSLGMGQYIRHGAMGYGCRVKVSTGCWTPPHRLHRVAPARRAKLPTGKCQPASTARVPRHTRMHTRTRAHTLAHTHPSLPMMHDIKIELGRRPAVVAVVAAG